MSFANRRGLTHIGSSRETRERSDEFDRRNVRNSGRDRSPIRGGEGSRPDYGGTRRSPRKSPRRFNRSPGRRSPAKRLSPARRSPLRRSLGRRSPARSPGRRSPPWHEIHSSSYRGGSTGADRSVFDQFQSKEKPMGADQNVPTLPAGGLASLQLHCELIVVNLDGRQRSYVENMCQRLSDIGLTTEIVPLRGDTSQNLVLDKVRDAADRNAVVACVINEQNVMHRSLTVYILHGQPQEHRNMPVESALGLITKTSRQFVAERENLAGRPPIQQQSNVGMTAELAVDRQRSISPTFQRPDENITNMLKMVINGSNLVVEELDEIIGFFQEQRDRLASARGIALLKEEARSMQKTSLKPENTPVNVEEMHEKNDLEAERRELQEKIRGMLASDPSLYESVKGMLDPKTLSVIQSEMDQLSRTKQPLPNSSTVTGSLPGTTGHKAEVPSLAYRFHDDKQPLAQSGKPVERKDIQDQWRQPLAQSGKSVERKDVREQWPQERFQNSRQQPDGAANVRLPLDANLDLKHKERLYANQQQQQQQQQQHINAANTTCQRTDTDMREPLGLNTNSRQREGIPESSFRGSGVQSYGKPVGAKSITQPDGTRMESEDAPVAANQQVSIKELQERILGILQGKVVATASNQSSKPDARTSVSQQNDSSVPPYNNPRNITRPDARTSVSQANDSSVPPYNNPRNITRPDSASAFYAQPDEGPRPSASTATYGQSRELLSRNEPQNGANAFSQQQQQQQPRDSSRPPLLIQQGDTGRQEISSSLGQRRDDANSYQRRFESNPSQSETNRDQARAEPEYHSSTSSQKPGLLGPGIPTQKRGLLGSAPDNGRHDNSLMQSQYGMQAPINRQPNAGFQGVRPVFPNQGKDRPSFQQRPGLLDPPPNWIPPVQKQQQQRFY